MNATMATENASRTPGSRTPLGGDADGTEPDVEHPRRSADWWYDRAVLAVLGIITAVLSVWNLQGATAYQDDEGTYTAQAFSILQGRLAPYTYWYDHPPLGWIQLGALAWIPQQLNLGDGTHIGATRFVMAPFFVATALLIYLIARRLEVRRPLAVLCVILFIFSPLALVLGRQVFLDNIGVTWLLLAFYLALSPRTALWHHVGAGAFFAVAVLSKETLAIFGPSLMVALLNRRAWVNRTFSVVGFLVVGGVLLSFYPLMALLRGELLTGPGHVSLQDALVFQFLTRSGSGSIWEAGSDRAELVSGWLYYDTYLIVAGLAAGLICLLRRRTVWLSIALLTFALPVVVGQGYLPAMYIIGALPFLVLALGAGLNTLWDWAEKTFVPRSGKERTLVQAFGVVALATAVLLTSGPQWSGQGRTLLTQQANSDWTSTLEWIQGNVSRDETVLAPYSMWQDLNVNGWRSPWTGVVTEKADLDPEFLREHPEGWRGIDWIVVGPYTEANIDSLGLNMVRQALDNSVEVESFGGWRLHRVQHD